MPATSTTSLHSQMRCMRIFRNTGRVKLRRTSDWYRRTAAGGVAVLTRVAIGGRKSQNTKPPELTFHVTLGDGAQELCFDRLLRQWDSCEAAGKNIGISGNS